MQTIVKWHPILSSDLGSISWIAELVHTELPERPEVFAEKVAIFPQGCRKLVAGMKIQGYGIAHPWMLYTVPPLDTFLECLPQRPECLYIHDIAILPEARGGGAAAMYIDSMKRLAIEIQVDSLALISVYGTDVLWSRFGFQAVRHSQLEPKLASYGSTAKYMVCNLGQ